jgi:hypothetical protein
MSERAVNHVRKFLGQRLRTLRKNRPRVSLRKFAESLARSRERRRAPLLVDPHLLRATPTVDRMMRDEVLHVRPHREVVESPDEPRPHGSLFKLHLDLLDQRQALLRIQLVITRATTQIRV